jgi:hypothetical protein
MFIYGHEPATESEMVLSSSREPIYSYCRGTIVYATGESTNFFNQRVGVVVVRYGRKYAVKHAHVVDIPTNITAGTTVEKGTLLGYTEQYAENVGFWESELVYLKSTSECRALPIVFYLDPLSRQVFDDILVKLAETAWYYPLTAPTTESWCSYVGTHEFWSDSRKFGVRVDRTSRFDSVEQFCEAHGLAWIIKQ